MDRHRSRRNCNQRENPRMNKIYKLIFGILVLSTLLLSGCTGGSAGRTPKSSPEPEAVSEPPAEPSAAQAAFEGTDLDGNSVSSEIFSQSKLTMVNVWATYCNPCLREMPELGELAAEYDAAEFQLIGIVSDVMEGADQSQAEHLVQQTGANYPHLLLNESIYYALLTDVSGVPTTFFIDENGVVLGRVVGAKEKSVWKEIINELLAEE